jgi:hypothetical protein
LRLDLVAYAMDCIVSGSVDLPDGRLTDALATIDEILFRDATLQALEDGRLVKLDQLAVARDELCVVEVHGPRGDPNRRVRTVEDLLAAVIGPYLVTANAHTIPTANLLASVVRRSPILAMTDGVIEFRMAGDPVQRRADVLALALARVSSLQHPEFVPRLANPIVEEAGI